MALGHFRNFLTSFSTFFSVAALALTIFAIVGPVRKLALDTVHYYRLDLSSINLGAIALDVDVAQTLQNAASLISFSGSDFGFLNQYAFTPWGYCESLKDKNLDYAKCTSPEALYYLDPQEFIQTQLDKNAYSDVVTQLLGQSKLNVQLPDDVTQYTPTIRAVSKLIFICGFVGIGCFALSTIYSVVARRSHFLSIGAFLLAFVGSIAILLAAAASTGMSVIIRDKIQDKLGHTGIKSVLDPQYYGLIWGAWGASAGLALGWFFAICCGRTDVQDYDDEK